jgi:transcription antitermination factor NusG
MNSTIPWLALKTRPRSERQVERLLARKGYECFLPIYRQKRQRSDRIVEVELPLFPTYVFCRFNQTALGKAIMTPGVIRIIGFGGRPAEVDINEIEALQILARSDFLREPWMYIPDGTLLRVETGPLAGAQGIFCADEDRGCLIISVTLLQRSVAVFLDENTVVSVIESPKNNKKENFVSSNKAEIAMKLIQRARNFTE